MKPRITVQTHIKAPIEKIWEYWTGPEHIKNWCHASDDWCVPNATNDVVVGGKFLTRMEAVDGSAGFDFEGTYTEIVPLDKIEYRIMGGRMVTVDFLQKGDGYEVIESFDPEDENPIEMQQKGWQAILDNFAKYVVAN